MKIPLFLSFILFSVVGRASEGFFSVEASPTFQRLSPAIIKVSVPKKIDFQASEPRASFLDNGYVIETLSVKGSRAEINAENCRTREMSSFNYFADACNILKRDGVIKKPVEVKFSGSGYFVNHDGTLMTAKHVVEGCKFYFQGKFPFHCPLLKFEVIVGNGRSKLLRGGLITAWSAKEGADASLDYALIKIDHRPDSTIGFCTESPSLGENVASIGFPLITGRKSSGRYADADGSQRISFGKIVEPDSNNFEREKRSLPDILREFQFADVDTVGGNSGGPLLSQSGCAYGTATRISKAGYPFSSNVNTEYMVSPSNAVWFSDNTAICADLGDSRKKVDGCASTILQPAHDVRARR